MSDTPEKPIGLINQAPVALGSDNEEAERVARLSAMPEGVRDLTAIYSDKLFLSWWPGHIRIAFGEEVGRQNRYRTAIILETRTARGLVRRVQEALVDLGEEDKSEEKSGG